MTEPVRTTFQRRKLGAKLRRMKEEAGFTLGTAAPRLDRKRSALHRVETGETKADVHLVKSMMDLYDKYEEGLLDEVREALKAPWYRAYGVKDLGYIDIETEAAQVTQFLAVNVPGLLQTEAYMRALFSTVYTRSQETIDNDVIVRLIRKQRLTNEDRPLDLVAIMYEAVLHREVGGPEVMREQLQHLIDMAGLPTVTLQLLPLNGKDSWVPIGPFTVLRFPEPEDPDLLFVEYPTGSLQIEKPGQVEEAKLLFERLRTEALNPSDSVALIERLATGLYGT
ncbi:hypothetical protein JOF56_011581 [Kibdelosporangium banguiense]|uniref:DUF5753 domain-containing protein n=1 Tax=Kibdelosporangium banguiense TaxID=1365924 RepID=A0ABS4U4R1_9PSEU|nr:helix-turn-helix transcriptional regulator [Kibdelosporangium banguiense]MBP2331196.1 hypothetical protein [Kibdelosporangium banguiense]